MQLEEIYKPIARELKEVELELRCTLKVEDSFINELCQYILSSSGKRIRPALVLLSAKVINGGSQQLIKLATAIELIHTATLIHDDVVDEATMRRKKPTVNNIWGNEISVLLGDLFYSKAFSLLSHIGRKDVMEVLSFATNQMCQGELIQINRAFDETITEDEYLDVIRKKTAFLFSACTKTGSILTSSRGGLELEMEALSNYGLNLGMAFQIVDDCLDLTGDTKELGKSLGSDLKKGKLTLPQIRSLDYAYNKAEIYINRAKRDIMMLGESLAKDSLNKLADYVISQGHQVVKWQT